MTNNVSYARTDLEATDEEELLSVSNASLTVMRFKRTLKITGLVMTALALAGVGSLVLGSAKMANDQKSDMTLGRFLLSDEVLDAHVDHLAKVFKLDAAHREHVKHYLYPVIANHLSSVRSQNSPSVAHIDDELSPEHQDGILHIYKMVSDDGMLHSGEKLSKLFSYGVRHKMSHEWFVNQLAKLVPLIREVRHRLALESWKHHHEVRLSDKEFAERMHIAEQYDLFRDVMNNMMQQQTEDEEDEHFLFPMTRRLAEPSLASQAKHALNGVDTHMVQQVVNSVNPEKMLMVFSHLKQLITEKGLDMKIFFDRGGLTKLLTCAMMSQQATADNPGGVMNCAYSFAENAIQEMEAEPAPTAAPTPGQTSGNGDSPHAQNVAQPSAYAFGRL